MNTKTKSMKYFATRVLAALVLLTAPATMMRGQVENEKFSMTTQMFLNELKVQPKQKATAVRRAQRRTSGDTKMPKRHRLFASPDTVGGVAYISCFLHLKDAGDLSAVRALGVEVDGTFDGLDFVAARVPVQQLEPLAAVDNVTRIKVARCMRPLTDAARQATNVDDLLTESPDALALGVKSKYDGTGVIIGIIDTGIDFQHIAFKDKDGNSRIKRAYVYNGSKIKEYEEIYSGEPTTDDNGEDHGTHTASTAGGSSVIVNGSTVTVTDDHASATYGGMAPGADLYLAGIKDLDETYLSSALERMVRYADAQGKPLVVSNSWGSSLGPRDGTGEWAELVGKYFGKDHPNRVILFAASNDAGHQTGDEGGGFFVKKTSASSSSPLGTIIRTDGDGGDSYADLMACAWSVKKLNCNIHVLDKKGKILKTWTVKSETQSFSGLSTYYEGSLAVYIEQDDYNKKWQLAVSTINDYLETKQSGNYTLAIEVYPASGSADVNMWAGDWSYFTNHLTTTDHTWTAGTDDMCVSDEATIPDAISVGAYVSKDRVKNSQGQTYKFSSGTLGDIAYFSSYATAEQSPLGVSYPWITAPGAQLVAGVNHYDKTGDYSYFDGYLSDLVVNNKTNPYGIMQGTSMATPVAAGIVALWLQASLDENARHKNLTVNDVKEIMMETAIRDSYTDGTSAARFGNGKIDALAGIQYILGTAGDPVIKATPTSIDFGSNTFATKTYTKTLKVKGFNLEGDMSISVNDNADGVYSLSQTTITQEDAADGVDITVTYAPQEEGTHTATITLAADGADEVTVPLTATAKPATPTIIADTEALTFTTAPGKPVSQAIGVLSEFLTGDVTVTIGDGTGMFSIEKATITKADSEQGATVTVTFLPADTGKYEATVTLSSPGAAPAVVTLSGTAATVSDETIDFTAQGYINAEPVTSISGKSCTITFDKGTNTNAPKYYDTGNAIRLYGGNSMTIASEEHQMVKIELSFSSKDDGTNDITTDVGTYDEGTWTGKASSVTFTIGGNKGHRRVYKVKVTYEGGNDTPEPPGPVTAYGSYELVTDAGTLAAGDKILIAYINEDEDKTLVLSTTQNNNNRPATDDVTLNADGTLSPGEEAQVITLETSGDQHLFNVGDSYLYAASSSKNQLKTEKTADNNAKATISIGTDGTATIRFQGTSTNNTIRYNPNNSNPIFSCYASNSTTGKLPRIYRQIVVPKGNVNGDKEVNAEDVMMLVSWLLGERPAGFIKEAADMDDNNHIDITDITILVSKLLKRF